MKMMMMMMMMMMIMSNHGKMTIEASCRAWLATRAHAKITHMFYSFVSNFLDHDGRALGL